MILCSFFSLVYGCNTGGDREKSFDSNDHLILRNTELSKEAIKDFYITEYGMDLDTFCGIAPPFNLLSEDSILCQIKIFCQCDIGLQSLEPNRSMMSVGELTTKVVIYGDSILIGENEILLDELENMDNYLLLEQLVNSNRQILVICKQGINCENISQFYLIIQRTVGKYPNSMLDSEGGVLLEYQGERLIERLKKEASPPK